MALLVKRLHPEAKIPELAHVGEDIGYDLFALDDTKVYYGVVNEVKTGISIEFTPSAGGILKTRSSMAKRGFNVVGGVIDGGYRGEIIVLLENNGMEDVIIKKGDKVAQLIKTEIPKDEVIEVKELMETKRGAGGFGSTGK